jgi:hypothetical protein
MSDSTIPNQPEPPPPPVPDATTPARKRRRWVWPLATVVALFVGVGIGSAGGGDTDPAVEPAEPAPTVTVSGAVPQEQLDELAAREAELDQREADLAEREAAVTATEAEIAAGTIPGDGIFIVGDEVAPGEYRTQAGDCYWARLSGTSGELDDIIANGNGAGIVTIAESDHAFESRSCEQWTLVP